MIAPGEERAEGAADGAGVRVTAEAAAFFAPRGGLERATSGGAFPYEPRPQQADMAEAVAEALDAGRHLAVEAGTGVGKSFAYLVPAILHAARREVRVVVATHTISLQEQLIGKDIPFLQAHLGVPFRAVLAKGRGNYLCLRRLARARQHGRELFRTDQEVHLEAIRAWARTTADGSLQDLDEQPPPEVWSMVCAEQGNCLWQKCPEYSACAFMRARRQMQEAHVLVVNHHLFFSDLALRASGVRLLPDYNVVLLDEAHRLEDVASEHFGIRLSENAFHYWIRRLFQREQRKGLLAVVGMGDEARRVAALQDTVGLFFEEVRAGLAGGMGDRTQHVVAAPLDVETDLPGAMMGVLTLLRSLKLRVQDEELGAEVQSLLRRGEEMRDALTAYLGRALEDHVYWIERAGTRRPYLVLRSAPVEVRNDLARHLFGGPFPVVMTSATLAVGDRMDYFTRRLGADECETLQVGSPFDHARQMRILIPREMPEPSETEAYNAATAEAVVHFARRSAGRAFVLFTSARMMKDVAARVRERLETAGMELLVQGDGLSRGRMLDRFRAGSAPVLFGLDTFWTGVDVRGEALSNVIIVRLPFAVPDQPVVKARMDRIKERGGDPFKEFSLPEAILRFRQGVGRLIRTATDEGTVVVLDRRIHSRWYGRQFLASIPECPVEWVDL